MRTETKQITIALDFDSYPPRHTCMGEDMSPRVSIRGLDAPYFAMILDDPDAVDNPFTHWTIWNIKNMSEIPENVSKDEHPKELPGATQGTNTGGSIGYTGPCPPRGSVHHYYLKVFGFDSPLDLAPGAEARELKSALKGHYREYGEAMATYGR